MSIPKFHTTLSRAAGGFDFTVTVNGRHLIAGWIKGSRREVLAIAKMEAERELARRQAIKEALAQETQEAGEAAIEDERAPKSRRGVEVYEGLTGEYWMQRGCANCED